MVHHPHFTKAYIRGQSVIEGMLGDIRRNQNRYATGKTLIVGAGTGLDIPTLPKTVSELVLLEPDASMRAYLHSKYPGVEVSQDVAESMQFADNTFDTVISSLVLCTVGDVGQALREIHRVLKPHGLYLFFEHVQHQSPVSRVVQNAVNPLWKRVGGGCHLNRNIALDLENSPLTLKEYRMEKKNLLVPFVAGSATKADPV